MMPGYTGCGYGSSAAASLICSAGIAGSAYSEYVDCEPRSSKLTPLMYGVTRAPLRSAGRLVSSLDAGKLGEGSAATNTAAESGSFGCPAKPAGSSTRRSCANAAYVVFAF
jgi:hypothetical protein